MHQTAGLFTFAAHLHLFKEHSLEVIIIVLFFIISSPAHEILIDLIWLDLDHLYLRFAILVALRLPFVLGFLLSSLKLRRHLLLLHRHDHRLNWVLTLMKLIEDLVVVRVGE